MDDAEERFRFINISHPDEVTDEATRHQVRRLSQRDAGKARRKFKAKRKRNEFILHFRDAAASSLSIDRLGGGELDPFVSYPLELNEQSRDLIMFSKPTDTAYPLL
jgi:hypothetical protein